MIVRTRRMIDVSLITLTAALCVVFVISAFDHKPVAPAGCPDWRNGVDPNGNKVMWNVPVHNDLIPGHIG